MSFLVVLMRFKADSNLVLICYTTGGLAQLAIQTDFVDGFMSVGLLKIE
jgi:hypothetical protein